MSFDKNKVVIGGLVAGLIVASGVAGKMYRNYARSQAQLNQVQTENQQYSEELTALQQQVSQIQTSVENLTKTKEELTQQLAEVNPNLSQETQTNDSAANTQAENATTNSSPAANSTSPSSLSDMTQVQAAVQQLATDTESITAAYIGISQNVVDTLAYVDSIPSGIPVENCVLTSLMCQRVDPIDGTMKFHSGVDLSCDTGTPIQATASGTVIYAQYHSSYGYYIQIDHGNGYVTAYAHCSRLLYQVGDTVQKGDVIALSGATGRVTGEHLHYEVILNGEYQDPLNYMDITGLPQQLN